jgi:hypothetical protein
MNPCCLWCHKPYEPRSDGGRAKQYCSSACRRAFDGAARAPGCGERSLAGHSPSRNYRRPPQQRARWLQRKVRSRATGGAHELIASPRPLQRLAAHTLNFRQR